MKNTFFRILYKIAVLFMPIIKVFLPLGARQRVKRLLLKRAFPIDNQPSRLMISSYPKGVNLVGYARAEMGIGESCRIAARNLNAVDIPYGIINFTGTNSARMSDLTWSHKEVLQLEYNVNLIHINAEQMMEIYANYGNSFFNGRYNIGYWHWELPDFPDEWLESFNLVDEVWVPSTFVADSISVKSPVPVVKIPHSIEVKVVEPREREYFGLPKSPFLFLSMYDVKSYQDRKNPEAAINAFKAAFQPDDMNVGLVIKVNCFKSNLNGLDALDTLIENYENIYLIKETISRNDINALLSLTDCFVSLHRSEGFGLGLAEAMYLRKPVIGTNWSSNTDFMDHNNSCLVDYELIQVGKDQGPYKAYQNWADPNVEHAANYMKKLVNDKGYYRMIAANGEKYIKENYSPEAVGKLIQQRLDYIHLWKFGG
ncbi:glycosyltransferase family 4 protein [Paenibacillus sp. FSL R7-0216]|uniref:glycosyltransferase family 4 protein n=1 Tax=Paenibacillus sp. FSL R7-0216 TaxID=2921677 RepID=UPI0030D768E2